MVKIHYEVVPAGGQRDSHNAQIIGEVIKDGGAKGWKFVTIINDFEQNYVLFEKPGAATKEQRG